MPVIKSAKKKLRQDRKREFQNQGVRNTLKSVIKKAKTDKTEKSVIAAVKIVDKAAKNHLIHKNKAARIKSSLAHLIATSTPKAKTTKTK